MGRGFEELRWNFGVISDLFLGGGRALQRGYAVVEKKTGVSWRLTGGEIILPPSL